MFNVSFNNKCASLIIAMAMFLAISHLAFGLAQGQTENRKESPSKNKKSQDNKTKADGSNKPSDNGASRETQATQKAGQAENREVARLARLKKQAQECVQDAYSSSEAASNLIVKTKIRILAANAYWYFQPGKAKEIASDEFPKIASISTPQHEFELGKIWSVSELGKPPSYKGRSLETVKAQLRQEMLAVISSHDIVLAKSLIAAEKEKKKDEKSDLAEKENQVDEVLSTAGSLADSNPEAAIRILGESLKGGLNGSLVFLLIRLREKSPAAASLLFNQALSIARAGGDIWEFQKLVPYILPTEKDRLTGGKPYLTDTQNMKDAIQIIEYAAALLINRIESVPAGSLSPELVRREFYLWRNLAATFKDLKPESIWLINVRLEQLVTQFPQLQQTSTQSPWSAEQLQKLLAAAASSTGEKRDGFLDSAASNAWRFGQGDYNQAISLAEKIEGKELREMATSTINFQAGLKILSNEGPDKALKFAEKINSPLMRCRLYLAIIGALQAVQSVEKAGVLHNDLLGWLQACERNSDTVVGVLEYLDNFNGDHPERGFTALDILVGALNGADLDPPAKPSRRKIYWYPEFHDFRKSLMAVARLDFERGSLVLQGINNRETAVLMQLAFCSEYLKMYGKKNK